jgi:ribose transport system ATP-binding protein
MSDAATLLTTAGLCKAYAAPVLREVEFDVRAGEVHALVGENGAGKTTLARILAGLTPPDAGRMLLRGRPFAPAHRLDAERHGVRMVMQELHLVANLTVAENIFLDALPRRFGIVQYGRLNAEARAAMERVGLAGVAPDWPVRSLGIGQQQLVEIAAGLSRRCDLLILDEPTAALTDAEVALLFAQIARLKASGVGVLYISHRLEEIQRIADRITVLRDGRVIGTRRAADVGLDEIIRMMVGRDLALPRVSAPREGKAERAVALRVVGLSRGKAVRDVSFEAREGEILGFAGLMGSGRTETLRAIFGADRPDAGEVYLYGSERPARIRSPRDAVRQGIARLTEDRKEQGLLLPLPVRVNLTLARLRDVARLGGWIDRAREEAVAARLVDALSVRCRSAEQRVAELSGGNQQKVVLGRWLYRDCRILIFDEPTRGIDVGAKFEIYRLLGELAERGKAILVASSDLIELLALCDRMAVMSAGRLAATFERGEWSQDKILAAALSGYVGARHGS